MLAMDLFSVLKRRGHQVVALPRAALDITDPRQVNQVISDCDVVANCAAWTDVESAETSESAAFRTNAWGPQLLAERCQKIGARLVHFSTDYVFGGNVSGNPGSNASGNPGSNVSGNASGNPSGNFSNSQGLEPYAESAPPDPLNAYGRTKAAGELAIRSHCADHLILRTAWLYGAAGNCFPKKLAQLLAERDRVAVVADQIGQPTWTLDVAELTVTLVEAAAPSGTYHATASGQASWFEFAREIAISLEVDPNHIEPVTSANLSPREPKTSREPRTLRAPRAPRPAWSGLAHGALREIGVPPIGNWRERWEIAAEAVLAQSYLR